MAKLDHAKRVMKYEIFGLVLLVLGIVTLGDLGAVGQALDDLCVMLAGNWHFLIPLYVIWAAVFIMIRRSRFRYTGMQIGIVIVCFVILTWSELDLFSLAVQEYNRAPDLLQITQTGIKSLEESLRTEIVTGSGQVLPPDNAGGGMIGYALFTGMEYLFALTGTLLVLVAATLVAAILITRRSLVATVERASIYFENRMSRGWSRAMRMAARMLGGGGGHVNVTAKASVPSADADPEGEAGERPEEEYVPRRSGKRGKPRKRARRETGATSQMDVLEPEDVRRESDHTEREELDGEPEFPFPAFTAPYAEEPSYEAFLVSGARRESDGFETPAVEGRSKPGRRITTDEKSARVTLHVTPQPPLPLAPDPPLRLYPAESAFSVESGSLGPYEGVISADPAAGDETDARESQESGVNTYKLPDTRLLQRPLHRRAEGASSAKELTANEKKLAETFESFGVQVKVLGHSRGPAVTRYEIQPAVGVKVSRIVNLADDLALALAARDIRIEAPIPGRSAIGIEVPNTEISVVTFRDVVETAAFRGARSLLAFALGQDIAGNTVIGDLAKMPHVLVAGATGSGKSVCINCIIGSILFRARPDEVKFIMIDPKMVELGVYAGIPHLFAPVVTEARRAAAVLRKVVAEMEHRYELFHGAKVRDLDRYNAYAEKHGKPKLPLIVVIIDELADLMMVAARDVEDAICRLAQMARASGIHLVVATQRPSVDVITGLIKTNIPSRIAFAVSSGVDSRTILDGGGAEKLLGRGDMLYLPVGAPKPVRLQGAFLSEAEVERLVDFVRNQQEANYIEDFADVSDEKAETDNELDSLFEDAVKLVMDSQQASTTFIQRRLSVGYARAARLVDMMEQMGIIGPYVNSRPREILMTYEQWLARRSGV